MRDYLFWLLKTLTLIVLLAVVAPVLLASVIVAFQSAERTGVTNKDRSLAVIELAGVITDTKEVVAELYKASSSNEYEGIILRIDSPGGAVGPSQEVYEAVRTLKSKKPIVVSMGSVAASGGLYAAMGASKVFANAGTVTGSIGVIMQFPNLEKISQQVGFDMVTVKSGKLKDVGNPFRPIEPEEKEYLQNTIDSAWQQFILAVADGRGIPTDKVKEFADGRIIIGSQAKEFGLVDEIGGLYDAARAVFELTKKPLKDGEVPRLVYPADRFREIKDLLSTLGLLDFQAKLKQTLTGGLFASL